MSRDELKRHIDDFFADRSRTQGETKGILIEMTEYMEMLVDSLDANDLGEDA